MITNNFLFNGSLGKAHDVGGSKCFSIPHTIDVPVQYSVNTNIIGDFIACSLNARLWLFKRSTRLTFCALKWNSDDNKLEFAASIAKSGEKFLVRGLDWILTDKSFVSVLDNVPYISAVAFNNALSVENDNENENSIQRYFSLLPNIGNFQIAYNLLIKRHDNTENSETLEGDSKNHHYSIHLELPVNINSYYYSPHRSWKENYSSNLDFFFKFIDNTVYLDDEAHIVAHNGSLWGRASRSIGQVFILPAVFSLDGSVLHYFLYFQNVRNDFNLRQFSNDKNIALSFCGEKLYAFDFDSYHDFCAVSKDHNVFTLDADDWVSLDNNGSSSENDYKPKIFFDNSASKGLMLDDKGITFLCDDISRLNANAFHQWIAPADKISALDEALVVAHDDFSTFATHPDSSFFREAMHNKILHISANSSLNQRFSVALSKDNNKNVLNINQSASKYLQKPVLWDDVYKHAVDFEFVHSLQNVPIYAFVPHLLGEVSNGQYFTLDCRFCNMMSPFFLCSEPRVNVYDERYYVHYTTYISFDLYYFDPNDGSLQGPVTLSVSPPFEKSSYTYNGHSYEYTSKAFRSIMGADNAGFCIFNNQIGVVGTLYERNSPDEGFSTKGLFIPLYTIPDNLIKWCNPPQFSHLAHAHEIYNDDVLGCEGIYSNGLRFQSDSINDILNDNSLSASYAVFLESSTNTPFAIDVSNIINPLSVAKNIRNSKVSYISSFSHNDTREYCIDFASLSDNSNFVFTKNGENKNGMMKFLHNLHFIAINNDPDPYNSVNYWDIYIFRSALHNDVFNSDSELERSYSS